MPPPLPAALQQELTKRQATELCALFRRKYEAVHGAAAAAAATASASSSFGASAQPAAAEAWPSLGAGSSRGGPAGSNPWVGRVPASGNGNGFAAMEAEPSGPPDLGGKTFAQIQAEEEAKARRAAKAAGKQQQQAGARPGSAAGGAAGVGAGAGAAQRVTAVAAQQQVQQAQQQRQQQPAPTAAAAAGASGSGSRPGVDELGDALSALKASLKPLISSMMDSQVRFWQLLCWNKQLLMATLDVLTLWL